MKQRDIKSDFQLFLKEKRFLPLSAWEKPFSLVHGDRKNFKENIKKIRSKVGKTKGLYVYKKGKRILYVGKGGPLFNRIKSHYIESYSKVLGDTRWDTWHNFFSSKRNKGLVTIFWKKVEAEEERYILEKMLQYVLKTEFEPFRKKLEKRKVR